MKWREVVGKFIVLHDEQPDSPADEAPPAAVSVASAPPASSAAESSVLPASDFDLSEIYQREGISAGALTAEKALDVLASLPEGLSPEIRRQAFKDLLSKQSSMLGVPPTAALEDARRKIDVLSASVKGIPAQVADFITVAESEIANFEEQIGERRSAIEQARLQQRELTEKCRSEIDRLTVVLQLLGGDFPS